MSNPWFDFDNAHDRLHGRLSDRGDLKYAILQLLRERPAHGYEVVQVMGESFGGRYKASADVYPALRYIAI